LLWHLHEECMARSLNRACGTDTWVTGPDYSVSALGLGGTGGFYLQSGSVAINAGESTCATSANGVDHDGGTRPTSTACDAGANEFGAGAPSSTPTAVIGGKISLGGKISIH
jgi:hypothetical protein